MRNLSLTLLLLAVFNWGPITAEAQDYQWTELLQPYSGSIYSMAINSEDKIYIAYKGTVYYSIDDGLNWYEYEHDAIGPSMVHVNDQDAVFIGTYNSGLSYTFDDGQNWDWHYIHQAPHSGLSPYISAIWSNNEQIYVNGFHSSSPFNWFIQFPDDPGGFWHFAERENGLAVGTGLHEVYLANNFSGTSWSNPANNGITDEKIRDIVLGAGDVIFLATDSGLFKSTDMGNNFEKDIFMGDRQINALYHSSSGKIYAGTEQNGIYISEDMGGSWMPAANLPEQKIHNILVTSDEDIIASAGNMGIFYSSDGGETWEQRVKDLPMSAPAAMAFDSENRFYVASVSDLFYSENPLSEWNGIETDFAANIKSFSIDAENNLYAGMHQSSSPTGDGGVYFSADNGQTWDHRNTGLETASTQKISFDESGHVYLMALDTTSASMATSVIFKSTDQGLNWTKIFDGFSTLNNSQPIVINDMELNDAGHIFLGATEAFAESYVIYSLDQGDNWEVFNTGNAGSVEHIAIHPDNIIFAIGAFNTYYTSSDNGDSWQSHSSTHWPDTDQFLIDGAGNLISVSNNNGVMLSEDMGNNWMAINDGLPSDNGYYQINLTGFDHQNNLFAITNEGFYTTNISVGIDDQSLTKKTFDLKVYPNPVRDVLYLNFYSDTERKVIFNILDTKGSVLMEKEYQLLEGTRVIDQYLEFIPPGLYLYNIRSEAGLIQGKLIKD